LEPVCDELDYKGKFLPPGQHKDQFPGSCLRLLKSFREFQMGPFYDLPHMPPRQDLKVPARAAFYCSFHGQFFAALMLLEPILRYQSQVSKVQSVSDSSKKNYQQIQQCTTILFLFFS